MSVLTLAGKPINWAKPPKATTKVMWSKKTNSGKDVTGSFRSICWLEHAHYEANKKFGTGITVMQSAFNKGVSVSAGTHDEDACYDVKIIGVDGLTQQRFFRELGAGAYYRTPAQGFVPHIHLFVLPPAEGKDRNDDYKMAGFKVGKYVDGGWSTSGRLVTSSQIGDYYNHALGLKGKHNSGADRTWFPKDITATIFDLGAYVAAKAGTPRPAPAKPPVTPPVASAPPVSGNLPVHGADGSHWNDWSDADISAAFKAGLDWMALKATQGQTYVDPTFEHRYAYLRKINKPRIAYHFAETSDPVKQAKHFLAVAGIKAGDMRPMLDLEDDANSKSFFSKMSVVSRTNWVVAFVRVIKAEVGVYPFLYTKFNLSDVPEVRACPLWVARYNNANLIEAKDIPLPKREPAIRQYTNGDAGKPNSFPGVGRCDLNCWWSGDPETNLLAHTIGATVPKPKPDPLALRLSFKTPMPASTSRNHPGYKVANAKAAIDATARLALGSDWVRALDFDSQVITFIIDGKSVEVAIGAHWADLGRNGWTGFINSSGEYQAFTPAQLKWSIQAFVNLHGRDVAALHSLRRGPNGEKPMTLYEAMKYAKSKGVALTVELKSTRFANAAVAQRVVDNCRALDYPCWTMALHDMPRPDDKCAAIVQAGGSFALIFGSAVKGTTARRAAGKKITAEWAVKPTRIW